MDASGGYTPQNLSPRQHDVLKLIVRGLSNKEIARALNVAEGTVKIHVAALFGKLGVHRRAAVANCRGRTF
ncbi:MAG: response regulator transcription factor [Alphaproteobacteria bacterium]|nr:MAG: response regulator transcription factor [Alphaproteobacteria bacterium]